MEDLNKTTYFYRKKFESKEARFNRSGPLPAYFGPMIGDKKRVRIAEVGAGPINTIGDEWPGVEVEIVASDVMQPEYEKFWKHHGKTPLVPVLYEDFESLSYANESFDIVHCVNAIDHTDDALKALLEFDRVCKKGGWIYLRHSPYQMNRFGGMHRFNIFMRGNDCVFESRKRTFVLQGFQTHTEDDLIVSIKQK